MFPIKLDFQCSPGAGGTDKAGERGSCSGCVCVFLICRPHRCISSYQSYSTFSSENFSVSDGEEGNTSDHSNSPDESANRRQDRLAETLDDLLSQTPEAPIEISSHSDGLSDKECAVRRVKTQMSLGKLCAEERGYEVGTSHSVLHYPLSGSSGVRGFP